MTLTDFLLARIAEDEKIAGDMPMGVAVTGLPVTAIDHLMAWAPRRVLAECEAKRRIVEDCGQWASLVRRTRKESAQNILGDAGVFVLAHLALPYADHPDYREEWRP